MCACSVECACVCEAEKQKELIEGRVDGHQLNQLPPPLYADSPCILLSSLSPSLSLSPPLLLCVFVCPQHHMASVFPR